MTTDNFPAFANLVHARLKAIVALSEVFVADVSGDALYERYLSAFPEGTNPKFTERTEHDCSCCRQFVRRVGSVVSGDGTTVWEKAAKSAPYPYNVVAGALHEMVAAAPISDLFRTAKNEGSFGAQHTRSQVKATGNVLTWNHFYTGDLPEKIRVAAPDKVRGDYRTTVQVFERGLAELGPSAVATVISLVDDVALYRGAEFRPALVEFQAAQRKYLAMGARARNEFVWKSAHGPAARFRNTVIGTLVSDLSEGKDIEKAVGAFEEKVAPQNYKRTTALITPAMVEAAMATVQSLGLESALERRFARLDDISINDVLWADSSVKPLMRGGLADSLMKEAAHSGKKNSAEHAEPIGVDEFIKSVLPAATGMEVLFEGRHLGNLMSLTAPKDPKPRQLFRWGNDFAWSYAGNVTDSIKERVKRAGGNITAQLRISLSWFNLDDLDLHVVEPGGHHIYYASKRGRYGELDVDMNAHRGTTRTPVENVAFARAVDGIYKVFVNNFCQRERDNVGFTVEVECAGKLCHFTYSPAVKDQTDVPVAVLAVKNGVVAGIESGKGIVSAATAQEKWGLRTESFAKVSAVTLSPNFWGENKVGNKHTFFVLADAKNDEPTRGIYNEYLHHRLEPHRKVFEMIGEKTKCQPTEGQLSGLGFSSTKADAVVVRVTQGKKKRLLSVQIGSAQPSTNTEGEEESHVTNQHL